MAYKIIDSNFIPVVSETKFLWDKRKGKLGANAMKCVAAGAHLPTPWFFEPAKRPDVRPDYCLGTRR